MVGCTRRPAARRWAMASESASRAGSISNSVIVDPASSGKIRISRSRLRAKTVLPAPIKVILGIAVVTISFLDANRVCRVVLRRDLAGRAGQHPAQIAVGGARQQRKFDRVPPEV